MPFESGVVPEDWRSAVIVSLYKGKLEMMVRRFTEVCRRRGLKVNACKSKVMVLDGEEGLECEVHVNGIRLDHVSDLNI